jgi:hypothetical protein
MPTTIYTVSRRHLRSNCYPEGADESDMLLFQIGYISLPSNTVGFFCTL